MTEKKHTLTIEVTEEQAHFIQILLSASTDKFDDSAFQAMREIRAKREAEERAKLPMKKWIVSRNLDAYVRHYAEVEARTKAEAQQILNDAEDSLFDLEKEGDIVTFDRVDYCVEGLAE
ncbi:MAG: hypothetical protein LPK02_07310 [Rhodobacterales bacterium]|nr:hypothetical protein [Rhodobacterales bacterium]